MAEFRVCAHWTVDFVACLETFAIKNYGRDSAIYCLGESEYKHSSRRVIVPPFSRFERENFVNANVIIDQRKDGE